MLEFSRSLVNKHIVYLFTMHVVCCQVETWQSLLQWILGALFLCFWSVAMWQHECLQYLLQGVASYSREFISLPEIAGSSSPCVTCHLPLAKKYWLCSAWEVEVIWHRPDWMAVEHTGGGGGILKDDVAYEFPKGASSFLGANRDS